MQQPSIRNELATFLGITFGLSAVFYWLILTASGPAEAQQYIPGAMWIPALAALGTQILFHRHVRNLGWKWPGTRWAVFAYLLPLIYATTAYGVLWLTGLGRLDLSQFKESPWSLVLGGSMLSLLLAAGEEIGWRGFLVPRLARTMPLGRAGLVSGVIWVAWHAPLVVFGEYNDPAHPRWYSMICLAIMAVMLALILAWLRMRTGSVWPAAILHASHNLYVQAFFDRVTADTGPTHWWAGEFGAALAVTTGVTAWAIGRARHSALLTDDGGPA